MGQTHRGLGLSIFLSTFRFVSPRVPDLITIHTSLPYSLSTVAYRYPQPVLLPLYTHASLSFR